MVAICKHTGIAFDAVQTETMHPHLRPVFQTAQQAQIVGVIIRRLRVARKWGITDIEVYVTFAQTGDAAYLAVKLKGEEFPPE